MPFPIASHRTSSVKSILVENYRFTVAIISIVRIELPGTKRQDQSSRAQSSKAVEQVSYRMEGCPGTLRGSLFLGDEERIPDRRQSTGWLVLEGFSDCGADNGA